MTSKTKEEIKALIPLYVNGTLEEYERRLVDNAREEDADFDGEIRFWETVASQLKEERESAAPQSPGEFGLRRLQQAIAQERQAKEPDTRENTDRRGFARWRMVAIAACVTLVLGFGAGVIAPFGTGDIYQTAGGEVSGGHAPQIMVKFGLSARSGNIEALLRKSNLEIVSGPSALGLYGLRITEGPRDLDTIDALIETLEEETDTVAQAVRAK